MSDVRSLKAVGYWRPSAEALRRSATTGYGGSPRASPAKGDFGQRLPNPADLVRPDWDPMESAAVVAYLRSGREWIRFNGWSYCRFDCGITPRELGDQDLTDGVWVWPEGLVHYVEVHSVRLPDEFIRHMREREWRLPVEPITRWVELAPEHRPKVDTAFWVEWAERFRIGSHP